jgi:hypothetical protein
VVDVAVGMMHPWHPHPRVVLMIDRLESVIFRIISLRTVFGIFLPIDRLRSRFPPLSRISTVHGTPVPIRIESTAPMMNEMVHVPALGLFLELPPHTTPIERWSWKWERKIPRQRASNSPIRDARSGG